MLHNKSKNSLLKFPSSELINKDCNKVNEKLKSLGRPKNLPTQDEHYNVNKGNRITVHRKTKRCNTANMGRPKFGLSDEFNKFVGNTNSPKKLIKRALTQEQKEANSKHNKPCYHISTNFDDMH